MCLPPAHIWVAFIAKNSRYNLYYHCAELMLFPPSAQFSYFFTPYGWTISITSWKYCTNEAKISLISVCMIFARGKRSSGPLFIFIRFVQSIFTDIYSFRLKWKGRSILRTLPLYFRVLLCGWLMADATSLKMVFPFDIAKYIPSWSMYRKKKWVGWLKFAFGYPQHEFTDNSFWLGCEIGILV